MNTPNTLQKRNNALEQLFNAYRTGMCNKNILELALEVTFAAQQFDLELCKLAEDKTTVDESLLEKLPDPCRAHLELMEPLRLNNELLKKLLLEPHLKP